MPGGNRIGGNLAQCTWTTDGTAPVTGEGGATAPPALNFPEGHEWEAAFDAWPYEDTTVLATDSPRFERDIRGPVPVVITGWIEAGAAASSPAGIPRLPFTHTDGTSATAKLKLIVDKNNPNRDYYLADAVYLGPRYGVRAAGGRKQRVRYRFVLTGQITQVSNNVTTTIR